MAGLLFLITGLIMGPMIGDQVVDTSSVNSSFRISSSSFAPSLALTVEPTSYLFQPQTIMKISGSLTVQSNEGTFDHVLLLTQQKAYGFNKQTFVPIPEIFTHLSRSSSGTTLFRFGFFLSFI